MSNDEAAFRKLQEENRHLRARIAALERSTEQSELLPGDRDLAWMALVLQQAPCGAVVASTSSDGAMLFVNAEFTAITGYDLEQLPTVQHWIMAAYPDPEYRAQVLANWERDVTEPNRDVVYRIRCADGSDRSMLLRAALLPGERMVVTLLDISEQQLALERLGESEERFRQLAETMPIGLAVHTQGHIAYANPAAARMAGAERVEELIGRETMDFVHPEAQPRTAERIAAIYGKERDVGWIESTFLRCEGTPFPTEVASSRIDWKGAPAALVIFNDITDRKHAQAEQLELERRVLEAQRMESLAVLAGGVAHDFNNLLVGMMGNADLALQALGPIHPARDRIQDIGLATSRAADLAKQMLAYSGRGNFVVGSFEPHRLIEETTKLLGATITHAVELRYELAEDLPPVRGDATQIRQVIMNLVTNAAEATHHPGAPVTLKTELRVLEGSTELPDHTPSTLPAGGYVVITVADAGEGMDDATRSRIFEPFFTTKFTGRGLGLAAVLGIVKGHGGSIRVQSRPGQGSSFEVMLPALERGREDPAEPPPDPDAAPFLTQACVLIVDDDETVRGVAAAMLEHIDCRTLEAADGMQAVELFRERGDEIDLVLLDLSMPRMGGQACYEQLRALRPDVRVVLSSGYNERDAVDRFGGRGLDGFIQKPYHLDELVFTVAQALS